MSKVLQRLLSPIVWQVSVGDEVVEESHSSEVTCKIAVADSEHKKCGVPTLYSDVANVRSYITFMASR